MFKDQNYLGPWQSWHGLVLPSCVPQLNTNQDTTLERRTSRRKGNITKQAGNKYGEDGHRENWDKAGKMSINVRININHSDFLRLGNACMVCKV